MRGTIDRAQTMTAKRLRSPLMSSCALAAALIVAGQARQAGAQAFNVVNPTPTQTGATVITTSPTSTTVGITAAQAIIDWEPNGAALAANGGTGKIDFMPAGRTITYESGYGYTGNYTVLNRIDAATPLTRPIGLDGTIVSTVNGARGGAVWFYSPGGIIAGATSIFNVGSLVLTANAITTTGGLFSPGGSIRFRAAAGSPSAVTIAEGAQVNLTNANSYLAVVAPVVIQRGAVDINGSAAYVSAEQVDITVGSNLFNISVLSGFGSDGDPAGAVADGRRVTIDHSGTTTSTVAATGATDNRRTYFVAVPKNQAITMLVSGTLGYPAATTAGVENGQVILAAGQSVFGSSFGAITGGDASLRITGGAITSRVNAFALNAAAIDSSTGNQAITGRVDVTADNVEIRARAGRTVSIAGDTTVRGAATDPSTAGQALATADAGGTLTIDGNLLLDASGIGFVESGYGTIAPTAGTGGNAALTVTGAGAFATITGDLTVDASGVGGNGFNFTGGQGRGGTASVTATDGGGVRADGATLIEAEGSGGLNGAAGTGGTASLTIGGSTSGTEQLAAVAMSADATGGDGYAASAPGGGATGGTVLIRKQGGGTTPFASLTATANAAGGGGFVESGYGSQPGGNGGAAIGGGVTLSALGGTLDGGPLVLQAIGTGGDGGNGFGAGEGSAGTGGAIQLAADGGQATFQQTTLDASGFGGGGGGDLAQGVAGSGGTAIAGSVGIRSAASPGGVGRLAFGNTTIAADGMSGGGAAAATAGRVEIIDNAADADSLLFNDLLVSSTGAAPTPNLGFFLNANNGLVGVTQNADINVGGSATGTAVGAGGFSIGGTLDVVAGGLVDLRGLSVGGAINATGDSISLIGPAAFDIASATVTGATGNLTLLAGTTLDAGNLTAGGGINLSGGTRLTTGNLQANNRISVSSASGPVTVQNVESVGGSARVFAGGPMLIGNVRAAGSIFLTGSGAITAGDLTAGTGPLLPGGDGAIPTAAGIAPGFDDFAVTRCDDCSSSAVALPFTVNYFGTEYANTYVSNNGYLTFNTGQGTYTPSGLGAGYSGQPIIAAFFADVDTRNAASAQTNYGPGTYAGRPAFGVTSDGVGYYSNQADKLNSFQLVLTDRSDTGPGNFDIYYNYTNITWETGSASGGVNGFGGTSAAVGYNAGTGNQPGSFFELPGSRVPGSFLNNGTAPLITTTNDGVTGQLLFSVRGGAVAAGDVLEPPTIHLSNLTAPTSAAITVGNLSADAVDVDGAGTANFLGNIAADTISIASADIALGTSPTTLIGGADTTSITLENNGTRQTVVGGDDASDAWSLSNAEFGRLSAHAITVSAPDSQSNLPDLTIGQLDVIGSAGADTATRRRNLTGSELIFNSADELLVDGALSLTGAGADDSVSLLGNRRVAVDTATGSVNLAGTSGVLAGQLILGGGSIYVGSRAVGEQLGNLTTVESKSTLLGTNDGVVNPAGFIQAGALVFNPGVGVYVQNSGPASSDPNARAGFTAGSGGVTIRTDVGTSAPEVVVNGRQQRSDGTFITGSDLIPAITFASASQTVIPNVALGSTVNSCLIVASNCGVGADDVPPLQDVINTVFDPSAFLITLLQTPLIELADFIPFSLEPLIDDPVTGAGNEDFWLGGEQRGQDGQGGNKS